MSLPDNLPHLCDIQQVKPVKDGMLGSKMQPETFASDIECWVQPATNNQQIVFARKSQVVTHTVYFRGDPGFRGPGFTLLPKNGRATCPFAGATLEVRSKAETTAGTGLLWAVVCEEIQPRR